MGKTKRLVYQKTVKNVEAALLKNIAAKSLHEVFAKAISPQGEKECANFILKLEEAFISFREYHKELCSIPVNRENIYKAADELIEEGYSLTDGQKKQIYFQIHQITKEINLKHHQTLKLMAKWMKELDKLPEEEMDHVYELSVSK